MGVGGGVNFQDLCAKVVSGKHSPRLTFLFFGGGGVGGGQGVNFQILSIILGEGGMV